jgi:hypothetical protein
MNQLSRAGLDEIHPGADSNIDDQFGYQGVEFSVRFDSLPKSPTGKIQNGSPMTD